MVINVSELKPEMGSLTMSELIFDLKKSCTAPRIAAAYKPENLGVAIEIQSQQLIAAWREELSDTALTSRLSNLLCDLVFFGESAGLDVEGGVRARLEHRAALCADSAQRISA
jgi:hypothetical protein